MAKKGKQFTRQLHVLFHCGCYTQVRQVKGKPLFKHTFPCEVHDKQVSNA